MYDKPSLNIKCDFSFSPQLLSETFFILTRTERDIIQNVYWSSRKVLIILVRVREFNKIAAVNVIFYLIISTAQ
jgi:hypothetical protein